MVSKILLLFYKTYNIPQTKIINIGITYLISGLQHGTPYMVRVASRNPAGISDYTITQEFHTMPIKPPASSGKLSNYQLKNTLSNILLLLTGYYFAIVRL